MFNFKKRLHDTHPMPISFSQESAMPSYDIISDSQCVDHTTRSYLPTVRGEVLD